MMQFADRPRRPKAISRNRGTVVHVYEVGNILYRVTKHASGVTSTERTASGSKVKNEGEEAVVKLIAGDPSTLKLGAPFSNLPLQLDPVTYEENKEYYTEFGKQRFLGNCGGNGFESLFKFLDQQADLKTWKNIEIHETEFGKRWFRVENFGGATTIERVLKVKNDV